MKKKYLIKGAFALIFGAFVASCSDYDNDYTSIADAKQATFAENFVKFYGEIDPNQDWGFGANSAASRFTRAISDYTNYKGSLTPSFNFPSDANASKFLGDVPKRVNQLTENAGSVNNWIDGTWTGDLNIWGTDNGSGTSGGTLYIKGNVDFSNRKFYFAGNSELYLVAGATLTLGEDNGSGNLQQNTMIYIAKGAKLIANGELKLNNGLHIYNHGTIETSKLSTNNNSVLYNCGTVTVTNKISVENTLSVIVNDGTITAADLNTAGSGKFMNNDQVTISGTTFINSNDNTWVNNGHYRTGNFIYNAASEEVINNCFLTVDEDFNINLGENPGNACFKMDAGSGVVTKYFNGGGPWAKEYSTGWSEGKGGPFKVVMGAGSVFKVTEDAQLNATAAATPTSGYGFEVIGTSGYAVFQAKKVKNSGNPGHGYVAYSGNLYVSAEEHFAQGTTGAADGASYIAFKNGCSVNNIYAPGFVSGKPAIKITETPCNPGFEGDYTDEGDIEIIDAGSHTDSNVQQWEIKRILDHKRVFCEDLGKSSDRKDFDYNDVVFDAKIIESYFEERTYNGNSYTPSSPSETNYYAEITVLAAGGELSLTVGGKEVNGLFKEPTSMIINTVSDADMETFAASHNKTRLNPVTFNYVFPANYQNPDSAIIKNIPVMVKMDNVPIYLRAEKGEAPQKICVPINSNGTRWAYERVPIDVAYGNFAKWVGHERDFTPDVLWETNYNEDKLYPTMGATADETGTVTESFVNSVENKTYYSFTPSGSETIALNRSAIEGQNLSNTLVLVDKYYFRNSEKGTVVRLYGVNTGNANVTVMAGDVKLGKTTKAVGQAWVYTLSTSQAASAKANGLRITGSNFKLYYVTVDDSDIDRTVEIEPTFSSNDITGTAVSGIRQTTLTSTGVNISNSNFANAGAGTEVYVYGTGDETSVNVSVNGSNLSKASSRQTRGTTYVTKAKKSVKFTMTAEQAAAAQTNGIKIAGTNFVLHAVGVVIAAPTPTPTPTPSDEQSVVWSSNASWNNGHHHFGTALTGVQKDKAATIVVSGHRGTWSWGVEILYDWTSIIMSTHENQYSGYGHWEKALSDESDGYVSIPLTAADVNNILANGLRIYVQNITTSRIEIKQ